jgi:hypothetical protein
MDSPEAHRVLTAMRREVLKFQQIAAEQYLAEESDWGSEWADAAGASDLVLHLTPDRLQELTTEVMAIIEGYFDDPTAPDDPGGADVLVLMNAFPFKQLPL